MRAPQASLLAALLSLGLSLAAAEPTAEAPAANAADPGVSAVAAPQAIGSPLVGTWRVERAIFELFGSLKDVLGQDDRFYAIIKLDTGGTGTLRYGQKAEEIPIEWDYRNGQSLTIAYGSRLKPQIDLYNILMMGDGSLFMRSTRLAQVNGTIFYLFRKGN